MNAPAGEKATRRQWIGLAVLTLPCLVYAMDLTVLLLAVPQLTADLKPSAAQLLWITDIYGFLIAGLLITMGTLGDRIGRRKLLMAGAAAFAAASLLAAFSTSAEMLIVTRALLGVAGATLAPSTLSLIRNMFHDDRQRTFAIGIWVSCFSAGSALGPVIGGVLLEHFWWGSVFLIGVPVMVLLLVLGPVLLPESKDPDAGKMEIPSVLMSLGAVLAVIYGVKRMASGGFEPFFMAIVLAGLLIGYAFIRRQAKIAAPLIDVALFRVNGFAAALCINFVGLFMVFGFFLLSAQYMQLVMGLSPLLAGLWMLPTGAVFVVGSMLAPVMMNYAPRAYIIAGCFLLAAGSFAVLTQMSAFTHIGTFVAVLTVLCFGLAPIGTLTTDMVLSIAPSERAGAASALSETSFEFAGAFGIAVLGSIVMVTYRRLMLAQTPSGTPDAALETLGGAVEIAGKMPGDAGMPLLAAARDSFVSSMELVSWIAAASALLAAVLAALLLRSYGVKETARS